MKRNKISVIIKRRFDKPGKLFIRIIIDFEIESIHQFRTEIKKLRAFLRLLNMQSDRQLKISKEIKKFYGCIGMIRNLQLQIKNVNDYLENSGDQIPATYIEKLNAEIELCKTDSTKFISAENFSDNVEKIINRLPINFKKASIKQFIFKKLNELKQLVIYIHDDEALHSIRKILKDILYNWSFIKHYHKLLPAGIAEKKNILSLTEILGDFCDKKIGLELLRTYCSGIIESEENKVLQKIIQKWQAEKLNLKQQIYYYLRLIQFS
jgi:CHAD domain-containing protein